MTHPETEQRPGLSEAEALRERVQSRAREDVSCPFCEETGFDLYGLKTHFLRGWCEAVDLLEDPIALRAALSRPEGNGDVE